MTTNTAATTARWQLVDLIDAYDRVHSILAFAKPGSKRFLSACADIASITRSAERHGLLDEFLTAVFAD